MANSIKERVTSFRDVQQQNELRTLLEDVLSVLEDHAQTLDTIGAAVNTLTAKLDADAGVTDVNYASTVGTQGVANETSLDAIIVN